ncbi:cell division protein DivIB [Weissella oryzae SG25]|uniref:Cell division protein DivIB n=1 Tax=Weissella oryzae (strain DSM 25784 / JCM 18191 / LMG 30913 / SG25) TaxID=1329250 RepID=A0A069CZV9_WEIOS|nr:cell division protein FtsQ/DivIB [Weissella oryzae]GAK30636.1 cell division protein DivIB [Weissella oryzae SG25]
MAEKEQNTNQPSKPSSAELAARLAQLVDEEAESEKASTQQVDRKKTEVVEEQAKNLVTDKKQVTNRTNHSTKVAKQGGSKFKIPFRRPEFKLPDRPRQLLLGHEKQALTCLTGLVALAILWGFFFSPASQVQSYQVNGLQDMTKAEALQAAGLKTPQSAWLLFFERSYFSQTAKKNNAQIKDYQISFKSLNKVEIDVKENVKVGYIQNNNKYYGLLADGTKLQKAKDNMPSTGLPLYENFKSEDQLKAVLKQFGQLKPALRHSVSEIIWSPNDQNNQRLLIFMQDGNEVLANADDFASKFKYYPAMAAQLNTNGTIDLQQGAFATPYGGQ